VSGVAAIASVAGVWGVFLAGLLMVPIAAGMVWPDRILERWSEAKNRAYSVREVVILEAGLLAGLCLIAWVLKRFGRAGVGWGSDGDYCRFNRAAGGL